MSSCILQHSEQNIFRGMTEISVYKNDLSTDFGINLVPRLRFFYYVPNLGPFGSSYIFGLPFGYSYLTRLARLGNKSASSSS